MSLLMYTFLTPLLFMPVYSPCSVFLLFGLGQSLSKDEALHPFCLSVSDILLLMPLHFFPTPLVGPVSPYSYFGQLCQK